jgi:hypothetical protein
MVARFFSQRDQARIAAESRCHHADLQVEVRNAVNDDSGNYVRIGGRITFSYMNLVWISAKKALKMRTKSDSVSFIFSPTWTFKIDFDGLNLIVLSADITPRSCRIELYIIRTSFRGELIRRDAIKAAVAIAQIEVLF